MTPIDHRQHSGACARNRSPILTVLQEVFPSACRVLEIASGTGEHGAFFAARQPGWTWQPSDVSEGALLSTASWVRHMALPNLLAPIVLDVTAAEWSGATAGAMFCSNMIHISPWRCTLGLLDGAARVLPEGGRLVTYGPYRVDGVHTAPSNAAFDASLQRRDPAWKIRDIGVLQTEASTRGLQLIARHAMPANNFCLVFEHQPG